MILARFPRLDQPQLSRSSIMAVQQTLNLTGGRSNRPGGTILYSYANEVDLSEGSLLP